MKIVQTSWACNHKDLFKFDAGWLSAEYHLMAWSLSCLQLKKYYDKVVLYADQVSSKMLIDVLQLPYSEVISDLDQFNNIPPELFGLPKIHVYEQQTTPFLHVDGDVFIWKPFGSELLQSDLIAQNLEVGTSYYEKGFKNLESNLGYLPDEITEERHRNNKIYAYNAGIIGGNDLDFFNTYTQRAKQTIKNNSEHLLNIKPGFFNVYFEQHLFYCLAIKHNKKVSVLFDRIFPDTGYIHLGGFVDVPYNKQYIHLVGRLKKNKRVCEEMANRLRQDYPEYYYKIISLFKKQQIPLKTDYYYFIDQTSPRYLIDRYYKLKSDQQEFTSASFKEKVDALESLADFKLNIVKNVVNAFDGKIVDKQVEAIYDKLLNDAIIFEAQIKTIVETKFSQYAKDDLYVRDISYTQYFEYLFADKSIGFEKVIEADPVVEIIESEFDWIAFDLKINGDDKPILNFNALPSTVYSCVLPECHCNGYSLVKIDDLDRELLQFLKKPKTINTLLADMKEAYEITDSEESVDEFEMLIIGRVRLALQAKIVKAIM